MGFDHIIGRGIRWKGLPFSSRTRLEVLSTVASIRGRVNMHPLARRFPSETDDKGGTV